MNSALFRIVICFLLALAALTAACAPLTPVRRTALIPAAALPGRVGAPLPCGAGRLVAEVGAVDFGADAYDLTWDYHLFPEEGDPGVHIPNLHLGLVGYYGIGGLFEIGGRFSYTRDKWSEPNATGVLPFPSNEDVSLWLAGIGGRFNFGFGPPDGLHGAVSILTELNWTSVPQAVYICEACTEGGSGDIVYVLDRLEDETFILPNLAVQAGMSPAEWVFVSTILGTQTSVTNTGFDRIENVDQSTLESYWLGYWGIGGEFLVKPVVAGVHMYVPFGGEDWIDFGPIRMTFQLGVQFGG